jgi:hypothetical protein
VQSIDTFCAETLDPFGDRLGRGVVPARGSGLAQPAIHYGTHHLLSTFQCQAGILVHVHSVLRESLCLATQRSRLGPNGQPP